MDSIRIPPVSRPAPAPALPTDKDLRRARPGPVQDEALFQDRYDWTASVSVELMHRWEDADA